MEISPKVYPYLGIGVIEIYYLEGLELARSIGSGYLFNLNSGDNNRRIIVGAAHNLIHLKTAGLVQEVHFTFYGHRDVYTAAMKRNGSYRFAVKGTEVIDDYGVMVLEEDAPEHVQPILLEKVKEGNPVNGMVAGGIADKVKTQDRSIYRNPVLIETDVYGLLHYPVDTTQPGMSGGPVLLGDGEQARSIGIIHGEGKLNSKSCDLAKSIDQATLDGLRELIKQAEAD